MPGAAKTAYRYLPEEPGDQVWGIFLRDAGSARIAAGAVYPPSGHPEGYRFTWAQGRRLGEFQIVYVARGSGVLETQHGGRRHVRTGQAFVLFPGEWHRYRPAAGVGWSEFWIGFTGDYAAHLMRHAFSPKSPVVSAADPHAFHALVRRLVRWATLGSELVPRARLRTGLLEVIAMLEEGRVGTPEQERGGWLEEARLHILTDVQDRIDWPALARRCGMGYATFRRRFKAMTGRSPLDYQIQVRLNRAGELLRHTTRPAREIAEQLGYAHFHFFSRQFKKRFGVSPQRFREGSKVAEDAPPGRARAAGRGGVAKEREGRGEALISGRR